MNRQEANREIIKHLADYVEKHPDMRFGQVLLNTHVVTMHTTFIGNPCWFDEFYTESEDTLESMLEPKIVPEHSKYSPGALRGMQRATELLKGDPCCPGGYRHLRRLIRDDIVD